MSRSLDPLFAVHRRELVPGLSEATSAVRDRQIYATTGSDSDSDPGAADRVEIESEADAGAAMAIEGPKRKTDMPMPIEKGGRR